MRNPLAVLIVLLNMMAAGCAGTYTPPPPLWDASLYRTVAVLPVRMVVATGRAPFTAEDTELSDRMGGTVQAALSVVMRYRGYEVLPPDDLSERLMDEEDLADAFVSLAASQGVMGPDRKVSFEEGMEGASLIGEKLGADLLVLAYGRGEYHSAGENLIQGLVTGLLTRGKEQYQAPPSYLQANIFFIDPARAFRLARIPTSRMNYEEDTLRLARILDHQLRRVPGRAPPPEPGGTGTVPSP